MCGIVGYVGSQKAIPILLDSLKKLEYRGYDSAGLAVLQKKDVFIDRAEGKLSQLVAKIGSAFPDSRIGIGHTRWATHGKPSETNAHPHRMGRVVLVHNGIVENYQELKKQALTDRKIFQSETDTEVICYAISRELEKGKNFQDAFFAGIGSLEGSYALAVLDVEDPSRIYAAKKFSPLVVGLGKGENFIASDVPALLPYTRNVVFLEDHEAAVITAGEVIFYDKQGLVTQKTPKIIDWDACMAEKGGYKHFMLKEIFEQPRAIEETLRGRVLKGSLDLSLDGLSQLFSKSSLYDINRVYIVACGTSYHAALAGKYMIEAIAKIPVSVDTASEFRYREPFIDTRTLLIVISQSGETADTLACVHEAKNQGGRVLSICNVMESSIPRASHATLYTNAGPEMGVASTKAFTTQLVVLLMLALDFGRRTGHRDYAYIQKAIKSLVHVPQMMQSILDQNTTIQSIAEKFKDARDFYYIARGVYYPVALEGALKLKEISYIHAEGYSAGEMKHGPIALIEPGTPVVALAPEDRVCEKMISNMEELKARGARIIALVTEGDARFQGKYEDLITIPKATWYIAPILISLPLQLLAYTIADLRGTDVDQPRNLAKSVTVE